MLFQKSSVKGSPYYPRLNIRQGREPLAARVQQNDQERETLWTNTRRVDAAHRVEQEGTTLQA